MSRVWVAMSGGVDSAIAAVAELEQGHDITGVTMRMPLPAFGTAADAPATDDPVSSAAAVCAALHIEHVVLDARERFAHSVVGPYVDAYASGITPNPCVICNERVKFGWLVDAALEAGAEALATGHYARIVDSSGRLRIARAIDRTKDQSYFLYALSSDTLRHVRFPLGESTKDDTRRIARELGLPVAHRAESQEACFVGPGGTRDLVVAAHPETGTPGEIVDASGTVVGTHAGIASYTIGQRRGLGIGGLHEPLFVTAIDVANNRIVVGPEADLLVTRVTATSLVPGFAQDSKCAAVVRYRMEPAPARVAAAPEGMIVTFETPVRAVAPGQSVVCYKGDEIVAGGEIVCAS